MTHIPVCGGERCVAELLLDDRNRYAFHHPLIGMGMTQPVRVDAFLDVSPVREARQKLPYERPGQEQGMSAIVSPMGDTT